MASSRMTYVRIKRRHETIFLLVEPSQSFASIRTRVRQRQAAARTDMHRVAPCARCPTLSSHGRYKVRAFQAPVPQTAQILGLPEANLAIVGPDKETPYPDEALVSDHRLTDDMELYAVTSKGGTLERVELLDGPADDA